MGVALAIVGAIGAAAAAASTGYAISGAGNPQYPNQAASSAQMAQTEAELLPYIRELQAQSELGGTAILPGYTATNITGGQQMIKLQDRLNQLTNPSAGGGFHKPGTLAEIASLKQQIAALGKNPSEPLYRDKNGNLVPASKATGNFTGQSQADITGKIMDSEAAGKLALEKQFDPQFIASALAQEKQSNPQGVAARDELYADIQKQLGQDPVSPIAKTINQQVTDKVNAGSGLTADEEALLAQEIAGGSADRGGNNAPADFSRDMTTGIAGEQRALSNAKAGTDWLSSGQTPEDVQYRSEQQNLANLSSFISGATPESQFKELSGAQAGATPTTQAPALATLPGNAGQLGAESALGGYSNKVNTPSSWTAGLSAITGAASTLANSNLLQGVT